MLFNSYAFLMLFLPVALAGSMVLGRWRVPAAAWLVAMSILFYAWWNPSYVTLLLISIAFNYALGFLLQRQSMHQKVLSLILLIGVGLNIAALAYYKYCPSIFHYVALHTTRIHLPVLDDLILPLGISFFTFTQIGYLIDCRSGMVKEKHPIDYALFVTFFPHLIAGPILHHREMMPQFSDARNFRITLENVVVGSTIFLLGLFKKVIIADYLSDSVGAVFSYQGHPGFLLSWAGALSYVFQLYFDFSGYSDMAVGLARIFGFKFPANFNSPLKATSIIDFWQRWHISLTRYMNLYLYNPISLFVTRWRVRHGKEISRMAMSTPGGLLSMVVFPTLFTMTIIGIWHGAGLQFLIYGLMHATYLILNHMWRIFGPRKLAEKGGTTGRRAYKFICWMITFLAVCLSFIMFRAGSVHQALELYRGMLGLNGVDYASIVQIASNPGHLSEFTTLGKPLWLITLITAFFIALGLPNTNQIMHAHAPVLGKTNAAHLLPLSWTPNWQWGVVIGLMGLIAFVNISGQTEFLYFRF